MCFKQLSEGKSIDVAGKLRLLGLLVVLGFFNGKSRLSESAPTEMDLIQLFVLLSFWADLLFGSFSFSLTIC